MGGNRAPQVVTGVLMGVLLGGLSCSEKASPRLPPAVAPRWLSNAEREELAKGGEDLKKRLDALDAFVAFDAVAGAAAGGQREPQVSATALTIKDMLHRLYYDVDFSIAKHPSEDPSLHAALAEFQRRAGLAEEGLFSFGEWGQLQYFAALESYSGMRTTPTGMKRRVSRLGGDFVSATGTWVMKGDKIAYPNNVVDIKCWREWRNCIIATGQIDTPSASDSSFASFLSVSQDYWDITSWSASRVTAETSGTCRRTVLTVDVDAGRAFEVSSDLGSKEELCSALDAPLVVTLEDPFDVGRAHHESIDAILDRVRSRSPKQQIKALWSQISQTPSPPR